MPATMVRAVQQLQTGLEEKLKLKLQQIARAISGKGSDEGKDGVTKRQEDCQRIPLIVGLSILVGATVRETHMVPSVIRAPQN